MALDELRSAKQFTQAEMAEILDVPQSSISRIERRADMYLSTLRNYIQAMGGVLQIQAVFPDGGAVVIDRLGEYEDVDYIIQARTESSGTFRLCAEPLNQGVRLSTKPVKAQAFTKTLRVLRVPESQITAVRKILEKDRCAEIGSRLGKQTFRLPELIQAGFEAIQNDKQ
jgi:transcriptional regulator with XRE-family HTH domain